MAQRRKVLTVREVARYLHVHMSTIYRLVGKQEIPAFKVGADWRFNVESIDAWRKAREISHRSRHDGSALALKMKKS
jgi:excisionase family DNA binding protein